VSFLLFKQRLRRTEGLTAGSGPELEPSDVPEPDFDITPDHWAKLASLNAAVADANSLLAGVTAPNFTLLQSRWNTLSQAFVSWTATQTAFKQLADDVISYAGTIVDGLYGRLDQLFSQPQPNFPKIAELLEKAVHEAKTRADTAAQIAQQVQPALTAAQHFADAFANEVRMPPSQITLFKVADLCLSYDGNGHTIAAHTNSTSAPTYWLVEPARGRDGYYCLYNQDRSGVLQVGADVDTGELMAPTLVHPGAVVRDDPDKEATSICFRPDDVYLEAANLAGFTLDCQGSDGWTEGTPVRSWIQNGGDNQCWELTTSRTWNDLVLYEVLAGVNGAVIKGVPTITKLQDDWNSVAQDLSDLRDAVLAINVDDPDVQQPFVGSALVEAAEASWNAKAAEAQAASAGL